MTRLKYSTGSKECGKIYFKINSDRVKRLEKVNFIGYFLGQKQKIKYKNRQEIARLGAD